MLACQAETYICLRWGNPPVRQLADFWTWQDYRRQITAYMKQLPVEFLLEYGYLDGANSGAFYSAETDDLITDLKRWISKRA